MLKFKSKIIIAVMFVIGISTLNSCEKEEIQTIDKLNNTAQTTAKEYDNSTISSLVDKIEYFHRTNIEGDYSTLSSQNNVMFSDIRNLVRSHDMSYFNMTYSINDSSFNESVLNNPITYMMSYVPEQNEYMNEEVIKSHSISILSIVDNFTVKDEDNVETSMNILENNLLSSISDVSSTSIEYMVLKSEIEVLISSAKSWNIILSSSPLARAKEPSWWDRIKSYAKVDAIGGGANVLYNSSEIIAAGAVTEGGGALVAAGGFFAQGALISSLAYGAGGGK